MRNIWLFRWWRQWPH